MESNLGHGFWSSEAFSRVTLGHSAMEIAHGSLRMLLTTYCLGVCKADALEESDYISIRAIAA